MKKNNLKKIIIDIIAMNSFCYIIAMPLELIIARMTFSAHIKVRLMAVITNTILGRPYGIWRDFLFNKFDASTFFKKYLIDTFSFISFQLPLYWLNMFIGGATIKQTIITSLPLLFISGLTGRPYGVYLEFLRKIFKLE